MKKVKFMPNIKFACVAGFPFELSNEETLMIHSAFRHDKCTGMTLVANQIRVKHGIYDLR